MKPKEFDELIRQKFDQNDFAYNPRNWDNLAEQMDGRAKKRSIMMWWLMPLAGIAASVAMAMGITTLLHQPAPGLPGTNIAFVRPGSPEKPNTLQNEPAPVVANSIQYTEAKNTAHSYAQKKPKAEKIIEKFAISFNNAVGFTPSTHAKGSGFSLEEDALIPKRNSNEVAAAEGHNTFKPEEKEVKAPPKLSIILSGGINHGNQNNGYMIGGTIRRMISDKLFIESDVAFASSNNTQSTEVFVPSAARHAAMRTNAIETGKPVVTPEPSGSVKEENQAYNLCYAQLSPGLGYKVFRRMSVGVGPDFQQMLVDNRPAPSTVDRNNIAVAPSFDIGFIGRTEYALTKKIKAGVYYRKGINNILTPMDKYIDRNYIQFQLKCIIFNK